MWMVAGAGAVVIRALGSTWRIHIDAEEHVVHARARTPNVIFAFWHGRLLPLSFAYRHSNIHVLASEHRDGEMLGQTIRRLGFGHVRGSSTRGGARAILELAETLRSGYDLGLTVDGPRGPCGVVKPGAVEVARLTGAAIVPVTTASNRHKVFASWDAFQLPWPFARVVVRFGEPVVIESGADRGTVESRRLELEAELTRITTEADRAAGA